MADGSHVAADDGAGLHQPHRLGAPCRLEDQEGCVLDNIHIPKLLQSKSARQADRILPARPSRSSSQRGCMRIGVLKEIAPGESRVALAPESCKKLGQAGYEVAIEAGAG